MNELKYLARVRSSNEMNLFFKDIFQSHDYNFEENFIRETNNFPTKFNGFCLPCEKLVDFTIHLNSQNSLDGKKSINWRETLLCPYCNMNNRQRLVAAISKKYLDEQPDKKSYFMEQVTPIFRWAKNRYGDRVTGSEYLGNDKISGKSYISIRNGPFIRHEDIMSLSFADEQFDLIISNDVFEHIPNPAKAFGESFRVLKKNGLMIATFPFFGKDESSITRACKGLDGQIKNIHPENFHGNPLSAEGSLVFTDFGWDVFDLIEKAGFDDAFIEIYYNKKFGILCEHQLIFYCKKNNV